MCERGETSRQIVSNKDERGARTGEIQRSERERDIGTNRQTCMYIYIYIHMERDMRGEERERERETVCVRERE